MMTWAGILIRQEFRRELAGSAGATASVIGVGGLIPGMVPHQVQPGTDDKPFLPSECPPAGQRISHGARLSSLSLPVGEIGNPSRRSGRNVADE